MHESDLVVRYKMRSLVISNAYKKPCSVLVWGSVHYTLMLKSTKEIKQCKLNLLYVIGLFWGDDTHIYSVNLFWRVRHWSVNSFLFYVVDFIAQLDNHVVKVVICLFGLMGRVDLWELVHWFLKKHVFGLEMWFISI